MIIGINWCVLIIATHAIWARFRVNRYVLVTLLSITIVLFDVLLEPVAMALDYWNWSEGHVPLQNYLAWFVITWVAGIVLQRVKLHFTNRLVMAYFGFQLGFFTWLHVILL